MDFETLYSAALEALNPRKVSEDVETEGVAVALATDKGHFTGACVLTRPAAWASARSTPL